MMASSLRLDRLEFKKVLVEAVDSYEAKKEGFFPQLTFDFSNTTVFAQSHVVFPDDEAQDPRHFIFSYAIKIDEKSGEDDPQPAIPYELEVDARAFLTYIGDELQGAERFRAVRFSGYQMVYGAIRELVSTLTARSRYGSWMLPSRNFNSLAKRKADEDEVARQELLGKLGLKETVAIEAGPSVVTAESADTTPVKRRRVKKAATE